MMCWEPAVQAQSLLELSPPREVVTNPANSRPTTIAPPRSNVQTLSPPQRGAMQVQAPLSPPRATDNAGRTLVNLDPPQSLQSNRPSDLSDMVPAIQAVRTQLEIMSPPPSTPSANQSSRGMAALEAPSLNSSVPAAQPQTVAGPPRSNLGPVTATAPQFRAPQFRSPSSLVVDSTATATLPPSAPSARIATLNPPTSSQSRPVTGSMSSILEMAPPASSLSQPATGALQSSPTQLPNRPTNQSVVVAQPSGPANSYQASATWSNTNSPSTNSSNINSPNANSPNANSLNANSPNVYSTNNDVSKDNQSTSSRMAVVPAPPTRIAQSPASTALPENYRPLAPPAQPGPQPGARFSQEVGSNQVTIVPPPGVSVAGDPNSARSPSDGNSLGSTAPNSNAVPNNLLPNNSMSGVPPIPSVAQPGAVLANGGGIEVVNMDPRQLASGNMDSMISGQSEPVWQFNFQNAPWSVVIRNFAKQNGMALQMLTEPTGSFTFVDERPYPASEALDLLNDYLLAEGFLLIRNGNKLTTVTAGGPIQEGVVPFVPMRNIEVLGRNELASVAIPIRANDAVTVMNEVQSLLSRVGRAQVVSNSSRLVITDTGAYLRRARDIIGGYGLAAGDMQTVVVHLKNTTADSMAATISAHLGVSIGASSGVVTAGGAGGPNNVQTASFSTNTTVNNSSTRVIPDRETNSLLLSGTPAEVADVQSLICQLDQARAQVILQGLILEVNLGNVKELGAELGLQDSVLFNRSVIDNLVTLQQTNTSANGVQTTNQSVVSQTSAPGFNFNGQPLGNNTAVSPNVIGAQGLGNLGVGRTNSQLGFGGLVLSASSNSVSLLLRALQANYEVDVLSRPQIRTVDNKEAFIQIGQQVPVVDGVNVTAVGTANPIIRQDQAGIILRMTPNVSPDGLIQIKVSAEKSAFKLQPGTGVPIFTDARNGTVIQAPIKDITTAQATISARAGQTIVLGGMITRDEETIERRVPGLSRIPLIGRLFRYDYNNVARKELLIFLTPHLIADDASSDMYKDSEISRLHGSLERAEEMHGPLLTNPPIVEEISN